MRWTMPAVASRTVTGTSAILPCMAAVLGTALATPEVPALLPWPGAGGQAVHSWLYASGLPWTPLWWMKQLVNFLVGAVCYWVLMLISSQRRRHTQLPSKHGRVTRPASLQLVHKPHTPPDLSRESSNSQLSKRSRGSLDLGECIVAYRRQVSTGGSRAPRVPGSNSCSRVERSSTWHVTRRVSLDRSCNTPSTADQRKPPYSQTPAAHGRMLVLAADDHPMNQHVLQLLLGQHDKFLLQMVCSGSEVLQAVFEAPFIPDIILLDVLLPDASGAEVVRALRGRHSMAQLPIIAIAGRSGETELLEALQAGANDFHVMPLTHLELLARMDAQLRVQRSVQVEAESRVHYALLSQVLPPHIISRLQGGQTCIAEQHPQVTMLFSDIVGFTELCSEWRTEQIVEMLDRLFSRFDELCNKHGVYKVETIGDAYMVVAGHQGEDNHAARIVHMAVDMLIVVEEMRSQALGTSSATGDVARHGSHTDPGWQLKCRIGLHTGPACSGVVGRERPRYCFFGDTVHTAQRMESNGFPGCIHLSPTTHAALRVAGGCRYLMQDCGLRVIKDKGPMRTYVVEVGNYQAFLDSLDHERTAQPSPSKSRRGSMIGFHPDRINSLKVSQYI